MSVSVREMPKCDICTAPTLSRYSKVFRCEQCRKEYVRQYRKQYKKHFMATYYDGHGVPEHLRELARAQALLDTIEKRRSLREELAEYEPEQLGPPE